MLSDVRFARPRHRRQPIRLRMLNIGTLKPRLPRSTVGFMGVVSPSPYVWRRASLRASDSHYPAITREDVERVARICRLPPSELWWFCVCKKS